MRTVSTQIQIDASPEAVWTEITDFASFPTWNPFILRAEGELIEGERISVALETGGDRPFRVRPRIVRVEPGREFRWLGRLGVPRILDGEHIFRIEEEGAGVRFIQEENFRGLLVPLLWRRLDTEARALFDEMNRALRDRVESRSET